MSKLAIITGGSRGIGYSIAEKFAQMGFSLILMAKTASNLASAKQGLLKINANISIETIAVDFSDSAAVESVAQTITKKHSNIDILVNSAGVLSIEFEHASAATLSTLFSVNCISTMVLTNAISEQMKQARSGYIINIASLAGKSHLPKIGAYAATKAALISYSESLYKHLLPHNVKVSCLCPSVVNTEMTDDGRIANQDKIQTDDLVNAVAYILSLGKGAQLPQLDIDCTPIALAKL
ncbi:SDR family NAD(P)-dependent oxidoreductase [Shewanella woodyi]|uniref:Short-chain dehydrogenase/reductase SDR n=1 Tax=Shewanella woodyi (strain ATCC 51908 / MS32) TaxID=392500 RepID=B1KPJ5_SHEWM|nr:SDR family NAD(P)-dependent oxidoreductase [Shewanella woodyi]ACA86148.1 short-chain dehydrogenase/reductase SDR [Shewanella woodyi ATCC 51908]